VFAVATDPFAEVFTRDVIGNLLDQVNPSLALAERAAVLSACGPIPLDEPQASQVRRWRAQKAAWDAYLTAAQVCGLLDGVHGQDVRMRLRGTNDENFRSAIAECMAAWFLAGRMKLPTSARPPGANGSVPDLAVSDEEGDLTIEVKAPYKEPIHAGYSGFIGDDAPMLAACLDAANKQFLSGGRNVLLLVAKTKFGHSGFPRRSELIKAFFGQTKIIVPIDLEHGGSAGDATTEFFAQGKFLKIWGDKPRFTRVSAVLSLGERYVEGPSGPLPQNGWIDHQWLVLHNPYCQNPVGQHLWGSCPQLIRDGDAIRWTDGRPLEA
jgi:hypothetical protein